MSLSGLFSTFQTHLATAGAAQTPPIVQIIPGEPQAVPNAPEIAYWLLSITPWESNTLSKTQKILTLHWEAFFPGSIRSNAVDLNLELRLASLALAIEAELMGDLDLGGNATGEGLDLTDAIPRFLEVAGTMCLTIGQDVHCYLSNVASIAV